MPELPRLDPIKLYKKALVRIADLNAQTIQMDAMIEALEEERDRAIEERDKAQQQLTNLTKGSAESAETLEGVVVG